MDNTDFKVFIPGFDNVERIKCLEDIKKIAMHTNIESKEDIEKSIITIKKLKEDYLNVCRSYEKNFPDQIIKNLEKELDKFAPEWFKLPLKISCEESVNGYLLYDVDENKELVFTYKLFKELVKLYNEKNTLTKTEFYERFDEETCSDWSKQDQYGNCFEGFWSYDPKSYQKDNAYTLSRIVNCEALLNLPYSHELIFKTIEIGCCNRMESVRYTNFICEYIKRKLKIKERYEEQNLKNRNNVTENICCICFDDIKETNIVTTECNHKYHLSCMLEHVDSCYKNKSNDNVTCPVCRNKIHEGNYKKNYAIPNYLRANFEYLFTEDEENINYNNNDGDDNEIPDLIEVENTTQSLGIVQRRQIPDRFLIQNVLFVILQYHSVSINVYDTLSSYTNIIVNPYNELLLSSLRNLHQNQNRIINNNPQISLILDQENENNNEE